MAKNPSQVVQKWQRNAGAATTSYTEGVNGVTEAPGAKAAAQADVAARNYQARIQDGTWAARVNVPLSTWKQQTVAKGAANYATGINAGAGKMQAFMNEFLPYADNVSQQVQSMPKGGDAEAKARMNANYDAMKAFGNRNASGGARRR